MGKIKKGYNWKARQVVQTEIVHTEGVSLLHCTTKNSLFSVFYVFKNTRLLGRD